MPSLPAYCCVYLLALLLLCGCEDRTPIGKSTNPPKKSRWAKGSETAAREKAKAGTVRAVPREGTRARPSGGYSGGSEGTSFSGSSGSSHSGASRSESQAIEQIGKSI